MPETDHETLSRAATAAIDAAVKGAGSTAAFAAAHDVALRTVERMVSGQQPVPRGLAREVARSLDHTNLRRAPEHAAALRAWADAPAAYARGAA